MYGVDRKNLSLGITVRHHSASLVMPISDPRDRFFYAHHTPMKDTYNIRPDKLSQVPPAEVLIIGCDRHTEVPVTVEIKTIKGEYSFSFFFFL